jgi:exopolysaccharide biosynthesis WecB/TagA/CpsF family protein
MTDVQTGQPATRDRSRTREIGRVTFEVIDGAGAIRQILQAVNTRSNRIFGFCNMHTFNLAQRSPAFASALSSATVFNDGVGIDIASRLLFGSPFPDNLNGTDLTPALLKSLDRKTSLFLVGSRPGVAEEAAHVIERDYPLATVVGTHHGFFSDAEGERLADRIRAAKTDLLLIGMGNPYQELWAAKVGARTGAVILCVGALLDFISGRIPRAPSLMQAMRIEWLYRLSLEPFRLFGRYIGGFVPFLLAVLVQKYGRRSLRTTDA